MYFLALLFDGLVDIDTPSGFDVAHAEFTGKPEQTFLKHWGRAQYDHFMDQAAIVQQGDSSLCCYNRARQ